MTDRQSTHGHDCWGWGPKHYECAVREIERLSAQLTAETSNARGEAEYEYEVWQGDALQAGGREADYASAQSEANHYAAMYAPDGPVEVRIYEKRLLSVVQQPAEQRALGDWEEALDRELAEASEALWAERAEWNSVAAALAAQPAASAEPVAWVAADTLNSPHPTCVSSLAYMSQLDKDRGREYVPLYAAPMDAQQAEIEALRAEVAAWRELSDHVRVGACAAIWPDRYTDARIRDVAAALKRAARMAEAVETLRAEVEKVTCELMDATTRADRLAEALRRYRNEVPIGHQPHMLAHEVDDLLREQESE